MENKKTRLLVGFDDELLQKLENLSKANRLSKSSIIRLAVIYYKGEINHEKR